MPGVKLKNWYLSLLIRVHTLVTVHNVFYVT